MSHPSWLEAFSEGIYEKGVFFLGFWSGKNFWDGKWPEKEKGLEDQVENLVRRRSKSRSCGLWNWKGVRGGLNEFFF